MNLRILAAAALAAPLLALGQAAKEKPAAKDTAKPATGNIATVNGVAVPRARADFMLQQQQARGAPDNEQTRGMIREELVNREVISQEAQKTGLAKSPDVQAQLDLARQEIIVGAFLREWVRKNPISDAEVQKEYEDIAFRANSLLSSVAMATGDTEAALAALKELEPMYARLKDLSEAKVIIESAKNSHPSLQEWINDWVRRRR